MIRNDDWYPLIAAFVLGATALLSASTVPAAQGQSAKPNIILIMADDFGYECVGANGGTSYQTPVLDQLAKTGMRFEHCYAQPLCTPSRVKLMTGIYNVRNYVKFGMLDRSQTTFANLFKQHGYATFIAGKWQLGKENDAPQHFGFDESLLWQHTRSGRKRIDGKRYDKRYENPHLEKNGAEMDYDQGEYAPDLMADAICDFMRRKKDQPFLVYYPMILTHCPFVPTPDSADWDPGSQGSPTYKGDAKYFGEMVSYMDQLAGRIVKEVDALGIRRNTLILFIGDNGTDKPVVSEWNGRSVAGAKGSMTDAGTRVPLIANWPGTIPAGNISSNLVDFSDFLPTLCDAASIPVPPELKIDGRSFLPELKGETGIPREWIYCWFSRDGKTNIKEWARNQRYKLYRSGEFYDVSKDVLEERPLSNPSTEARQIRVMLQQALDQYKDARPAEKTEGNLTDAGGEAALNVRDYGAKGDGRTLDSPFIQKAIDACNRRGGGEVLVPPGQYLCGTILLKDGVTLRLDEGAVILGSRELDDYENPDFFVDAVNQERGWCLVGIIDVRQVAIVGNGTIDGRGEDFRGRRPFLIRCVRSEDVLIEGVRLRNSAAWVTHLYQSKRVAVKGVDILSHANGNNDGIDVDSSSDVLIEECTIDTGDDAVCIKATSPLPSENITVRNCRLKSDWGAFKLGTESMGDFKNIRFTDSVIHDTKGGAMKILSMDGCRLENLTVDNITVKNSDMMLFMRLGVRLNKYREAEARTPGHFKDVKISNVTARMSAEGKLHAPTGIIMLGEKTDDATYAIENVLISNVVVAVEGGGLIDDVGTIPERTRKNNYPEYIFFFGRDAKRIFPAYGIYARHVAGVTFEDVNIITRTPDTRPCVFLEDAHDVKVNATTSSGNGPFMQTKASSRITGPNS